MAAEVWTAQLSQEEGQRRMELVVADKSSESQALRDELVRVTCGGRVVGW